MRAGLVLGLALREFGFGAAENLVLVVAAGLVIGRTAEREFIRLATKPRTPRSPK